DQDIFQVNDQFGPSLNLDDQSELMYPQSGPQDLFQSPSPYDGASDGRHETPSDLSSHRLQQHQQMLSPCLTTSSSPMSREEGYGYTAAHGRISGPPNQKLHRTG